MLAEHHSLLIYKASYLLCITNIYGAYMTHYALIPFPSIAFISSINHWRNPQFDWKRTIDIFIVRGAIISHSILVYNADYANAYYSVLGLSLLLYPISWYYYYKKQYTLSTYIHVLHHILNNIAAIIVYSGNIPIKV